MGEEEGVDRQVIHGRGMALEASHQTDSIRRFQPKVSLFPSTFRTPISESRVSNRQLIQTSETQLRSRLKKWRVTKPSRQTRKKSHASSGDEPDEIKRKPSVQRPLPSLHRDARHEWPVQSIYGVPEDRKWSSPMVQQLTPSPSGEHVLASDRSVYPDTSPTTTSFEPHTSPVNEGLILNTTVPPYSNSYPLSPESCLPSPGTTTSGVAWPARSVSADYGLNPAQWYSLPFEAITPPSSLPPQTTAPMNPTITGYMPPGQYHAHPYYPESEYHYDKNWRRAMSLQYDMHGHAVPGREGERKLQPHPMASPSTQSGSHSVMCAPIMPYMGEYAQKPPGVGY